MNHRTVLITGGTQGIGRACAERFARAGDTVHVTYGRADEAEKACSTVEAIQAAGGSSFAHHCDQGDPAAVDALWDECGEAVDVLILNAAHQKKVRFDDTDRTLLERTFAVNLFGATQFLQRFHRSRRAVGKPGVAILHSSDQAEFVNPTGFAYALSKAALNHLVHHAARAMARDNIRVNGVSLGWFDTEGERAFYSAEQMARQAEQNVVMGRIGDPKEVAALAFFLASDECSYMTGSLVRYDGGFALAPDSSA